MVNRNKVIILIIISSVFLLVAASSGLFSIFANNNSNVILDQRPSSSQNNQKSDSEGNKNRKPSSWNEFLKKQQQSSSGGSSVSCQKSSSFELPFGGASALKRLLIHEKKSSLSPLVEEGEKSQTGDSKQQQQTLLNDDPLFFGRTLSSLKILDKRNSLVENSISSLFAVSGESMKQCRPVSTDAFQSAAEALVVSKNPGRFCPTASNLKQSGVTDRYQLLVKAGHPVAKYVTVSEQLSNSIRKKKVTHVLSILLNSNKKNETTVKAENNNNNEDHHHSSSSTFLCPQEWLDAGATVVECNKFFDSKSTINSDEQEKPSSSSSSDHRHDNDDFLEKMMNEQDDRDIEEAAAASLLLVKRIKSLLEIRSSIGWVDNNNENNNNDNEEKLVKPSAFSSNENVSTRQEAAGSSSSENDDGTATSSSVQSSSASVCALPLLSGGFLSLVRQTLLQDRLDHELSLFSDSVYVAAFEHSVPPMMNLPFFSNGHNLPANEKVQYQKDHSDMTVKSGGFPTFEFLGAQPGLFAAVFTKAVVGYSYVFTCVTGRMYGNGGSKEHRFEFASSEIGGKKSSKSNKLPCRPVAAAFSRPPIRVGVPLCTSRYCRWYGIYHFMLEHLPQLTTALDVLTQVDGALLVVTEAPSLTTRSLLVDAMGIPADRIVVGPFRADVAVLPTPGLVYRPMTHALRYFRRVILARMGLDWRSSISGEKKKTKNTGVASSSKQQQRKQKRDDNDGATATTTSRLNPFSSLSAPQQGEYRHFPRRYCFENSSSTTTTTNKIPEIRILLSERGAIKASAEQKQVRLPLNWQQVKRTLRTAFPCVRFQTEKEVREDVRDTIFAFYEADIVLGIHGANLLFTSFMRRGTHLIEMISNDASMNPRCFYNLAAEVGVKYSSILHSGAFKLQEYNYKLDPEMVVERVQMAIDDIVKRI